MILKPCVNRVSHCSFSIVVEILSNPNTSSSMTMQFYTVLLFTISLVVVLASTEEQPDDLVQESEMSIAKRGANFGYLILKYTGRSPTDYQYGCYCGLGGRGKPFDATDRCCQVHDQCYGRIQRGICNYYDPYYKSYVHWGLKCLINHTGWWWRRRLSCTSEICLCDVNAVKCFRRNLRSYNNRLRNYNKNRC